MTPGTESSRVEALRGFNRFYTRQIGVLDEGLLKTPYTLAQARVLFELGTREDATAGEIADALGLDLGYLSRILRGFESRKLLSRRRSPNDGRRILLTLTAKGRKVFRDLDARSRDDVSAVLARLPEAKRVELLDAVRNVQSILSDRKLDDAPREIVLRTHRIGDIGWAIERHGRLYADEYGWNEEFEALVAKLFANFANEHDPSKERFWVAELDGERVGCVFVVQNDEDRTVAQLRCLLVDPEGRGLGIGRRLVATCVAFARSAGYGKMILWTNDVLVSARRIYEAAGFQLVEEKAHRSFGHELVGQVWQLEFNVAARM